MGLRDGVASHMGIRAVMRLGVEKRRMGWCGRDQAIVINGKRRRDICLSIPALDEVVHYAIAQFQPR
jgi:hypothetical protein